MNTPKCPKCGESGFEMATHPIVKGSERAIYYVCCSDCGTVVGVLDDSVNKINQLLDFHEINYK